MAASAEEFSRAIEALLREGVVSQVDAERATSLGRARVEPATSWLLAEGRVSEEDLYFLLARSGVAPAVPEERLRNLSISTELRRRCPKWIAERLLFIPLAFDSMGTLSIAASDPTDESAIERLRVFLGAREVRRYLARRSLVLAAIEQCYGTQVSATDEVALAKMRDCSGMEDSADDRETQVEVIPGKVSLDPSLFREMAEADPGLAEAARRARSARPDPARPDPARPARPDPARPARPARPAPRQQPSAYPDSAHGIIESYDGDRGRRGGRGPRIVTSNDAHRGSSSDPGRGLEVHSGRIDTSPQRVSARRPTNAPLELLADEALSEDTDSVVTVPRVAASSTPAAVSLEVVARTPPRPHSAVENGHGVEPEDLEDPGQKTPRGDTVRTGHPSALDESHRHALSAALHEGIDALIDTLSPVAGTPMASPADYRSLAFELGEELALPPSTLRAVATAVGLYQLDSQLRAAAGNPLEKDIRAAFDDGAEGSGGIAGALRRVGASCLGSEEHYGGRSRTVVTQVGQLVVDYVALASSNEDADFETIVQLMRAGGGDSVLIEALVRAVRT